MKKREFLLNRREMLVSSALAPFVFGTARAVIAELAQPLYKLSINIEQLFPDNMSRTERMQAVAAIGEKAFSFWRAPEDELNRMLDVQQKTGLKCGSISGNGPTMPRNQDMKFPGSAHWYWAPQGPSPMRPGNEKAFLDDVTYYAKLSKRFGGPDAIILLGGREKDIPWEAQRANLVSNLRRAGDIAGVNGIVFAWETTGALLPVSEAYSILEEVNHPHMKLDFDVSLIQNGQGNVLNYLKEGLKKGLIQLFECADTPDRVMLGTGELNWQNLFRALRESGYKGWVGTEQTSINGYDGSLSSPEQAIQITRKVAFGS